MRLIRLDVDRDDSVREAFAEVFETSGQIDVLVNNAGVTGPGTIEETPLDEFRRQMETNFFGLLRCTQAVLPSMRERRSGCIVNISSLGGRFVRPGMGIYCASKHAVEAVSEAMAYELAPFGVRVVIVEPGVVVTPIWTKVSPPGRTSYPHLGMQTMAYYARMFQSPTLAGSVADVIAGAIASDHPKLRYPVGWHAETLLAARPDIPDEAMVALARLDGDAWKAEWKKLFGFSL